MTLSDFSATAKNARLQIPVPPLDFEAIRLRSAASGARERLRRLVAVAAMALGVGGAAAAFASTIGGWHIWFFGNKVEATVQSLGIVRYPRAADVRNVVARATFPVVLPDGVPSGLRVTGIAYTPIDRPTMMTIQYGNALNPYAITISLIDTKKIAADEKLLPPGPAQALVMAHPYRFLIEHEMVLMHSGPVAQRVEAAMKHESPAQTAAAFDALLTRIIVLQKVTPRVAQVAEQVAPAGGDVVVADWDIRLIPRLARAGKPLRDSRVVYLTSIPQVHGQPDYRDATLSWPKAIAIAPNGVRAAATVLRRSHTGPNCSCAILVHASSGGYTVWKIDQRTLRVTKLSE
jgi:hypothetical protein